MYKKKKMGITDYIFFLLSRRDYSYKEIYNKLIEREEDPHEIKEILQKMIEHGYQSDERMAISYFNSRKNKRGSKVISFELKNKGISDEIINKVIFENKNEDNTENILNTIRKFKKYNLDDHKIKQKIIRSIISKGFDFKEANKALSKLKEEKKIEM